MKEFEIWSEGYRATGEEGFAMCHGKFMAETFDDAVILANETVKLGAEPYTRASFTTDEHFENRRSDWKIWGCALFDNETDARKSFG